MGQEITLGQARELALLAIDKVKYSEEEYKRKEKEILDKYNKIEKCPFCGNSIGINIKDNIEYNRFDMMDI